MLHVATCLWDANDRSLKTSRCFSEAYVEKLYRGFCRHLTLRFRFVCFTDRRRRFCAGIDQEMLTRDPPDYGCYIEPFRLDRPTIIAGLDTLVVRNINHLALYCLEEHALALPRDPYKPERSINAIALVPAGHRFIYTGWRGENDMEWLRKQSWTAIDDLFPGQVISLKFSDARRKGIQDARIVYMHGTPKPHELTHLPWVKDNWQ